MSRKDAVVLASRTLALLFTVWALAEASYFTGIRTFASALHHRGYVIDHSRVLAPLLPNADWLSRYEDGRLLSDCQVAL
jgi:hypothetical protein